MTDKRLGPDSGASGWNMYVFRDGRQAVSGPSLRSQLADAVSTIPESADPARNNELI